MSTDFSPTSQPLPAPALGEPYLLTPGPLTTAFSTKEAMLKDWGSWDADFRAMTKSVCDQLVALAGDTTGEFVCVPMQGSGSFSVEAMLGTFVPRTARRWCWRTAPTGSGRRRRCAISAASTR